MSTLNIIYKEELEREHLGKGRERQMGDRYEGLALAHRGIGLLLGRSHISIKTRMFMRRWPCKDLRNIPG